MRILHLISDHQVVERTMGVYEKVFPNSNDFLIFSNELPLKHIKTLSSYTIVTKDNVNQIAQNYDFSKVTHVIAHYMSMEKIDFIKYVPKDIHVCWEIYGGDLYNQFLESFGYRLFYVNPEKYRGKYRFLAYRLPYLFDLLRELKGYKYCLKSSKIKQFHCISQRVNSIQYCCEYDAKYVEQYAGRKIPSYEVFNYSLSEVLGDLIDAPFSEGNDIMVGNSASLSNNHLYVLKYLKPIIIDNHSQIIIPLSYGGTPKYIDEVENDFKEAFPNQVRILRNYLPIQEYNNLFLGLKSAVFSAWRQESIGNIIMCLYMGIKTYMSERSPLYKYLKECGFVLYDIESAKKEDFATALSNEAKQTNRSLVLNHYDENRFIDSFKTNIR